MEIPDELVSLFSARVEWRQGSFVVEVPTNEVRYGTLDLDATYRVALLSARSPDRDALPVRYRPVRRRRRGAVEIESEPPVAIGDVLTVEIEDIGEQGDGIARVDGEFVIFVPGTSVGDEVTIEVTHVVDTYAFGHVLDGADDE
ncbi:MAG: TRAM domain-containing protein [Salinigranum sp.]